MGFITKLLNALWILQTTPKPKAIVRETKLLCDDENTFVHIVAEDKAKSFIIYVNSLSGADAYTFKLVQEDSFRQHWVTVDSGGCTVITVLDMCQSQ